MRDRETSLGETLLEESFIHWDHGRNKLLKIGFLLIGLGFVVLLSYVAYEQHMSVKQQWQLHRADLDYSTLGRSMPLTRMAACFSPTPSAFKHVPPLYVASDRLKSLVVGSPQQHDSGHRSATWAGFHSNMEAKWGPVLDTTLEDSEPRNGAVTLPVFPIADTVLPFTSHMLLIIEPRYRAMYDDILVSGSRRFVVCNADDKTGRLSEYGVIFHLEDLKELSQLTNDTLKFAGQHSVIGRVKLLKVLNPRAALSRETYLRVEVAEVVDADAAEDTSDAEAFLRNAFDEVVDLQNQLGEQPRFNETAKSMFDFSRGTSLYDQGLWGTMRKWQTFLEKRAVARDQKMWSEFQHETELLLKSKGFDLVQMLSKNRQHALSNLPRSLKALIRKMRDQYYERFAHLEDTSATSAEQAMLQSGSHAERLSIFYEVINEERKRLAACKSLAFVFQTGPAASPKF